MLAGTTAVLVVYLAAGAIEARAGTWSVEVEPVYVEVTGHDQHVLTVRQDSASGPGSAVTLETDSALGYRAAVRYDRDRWDYGLDFFIHRTDQAVAPLRSAASTGARRVFELPGRSFTSTSPLGVLYYQTLEDTTVELWVLDLYARRELAASSGRSWGLILGLRNADFDNDYRAIAGLEDVGGVRIDASSNYSRMMGPVVGLVVNFERGRHDLGADLRQSVVLGDIELTRTLRDFTGPPGPFAGPPEEVPAGFNQERLATTDSITVPMTDLRLAWSFRLNDHWSLGASLGATAWWDLAVPPGVVPGRAESLEEVTLVTYGAGANLRFSL